PVAGAALGGGDPAGELGPGAALSPERPAAALGVHRLRLSLPADRAGLLPPDPALCGGAAGLPPAGPPLALGRGGAAGLGLGRAQPGELVAGAGPAGGGELFPGAAGGRAPAVALPGLSLRAGDRGHGPGLRGVGAVPALV